MEVDGWLLLARVRHILRRRAADIVVIPPAFAGCYVPVRGNARCGAEIYFDCHHKIEQLTAIIASPFSFGVSVLIYYDLRIRKEGFDLEIMSSNSSA